MNRLVKKYLGLKVYKRIPRQALKPVEKEKHLARSKILLNMLKKKPADVVVLFSYETPFSLGEIVANDTGFYLAGSLGARDDDVVHVGKERHFANLQVLAVVASDGQECDLIFLEDHERLNSETYCQYLKDKLFPRAGLLLGTGGGGSRTVPAATLATLPKSSFRSRLQPSSIGILGRLTRLIVRRLTSPCLGV
uniref:Uncharacterized protein n=1 Tax=Lepeophtheirus salmonis TaxID=72036 RepID=A0A0K2U1H5_LEPSM